MKMEKRIGSNQARRRGALLFIAEPRTRPEHVIDKRGQYMACVQINIVTHRIIGQSSIEEMGNFTFIFLSFSFRSPSVFLFFSRFFSSPSSSLRSRLFK